METHIERERERERERESPAWALIKMFCNYVVDLVVRRINKAFDLPILYYTMV